MSTDEQREREGADGGYAILCGDGWCRVQQLPSGFIDRVTEEAWEAKRQPDGEPMTRREREWARMYDRAKSEAADLRARLKALTDSEGREADVEGFVPVGYVAVSGDAKLDYATFTNHVATFGEAQEEARRCWEPKILRVGFLAREAGE